MLQFFISRLRPRVAFERNLTKVWTIIVSGVLVIEQSVEALELLVQIYDLRKYAQVNIAVSIAKPALRKITLTPAQ